MSFKSHWPYDVSTIISTILQMNKLLHKDEKFAQQYTGSQ